MAFTLVQKAGYAVATGSAPSLAFSSNNTAGNLLVACVHEATSGFVDVNTFTITDTRGNTWKRAGLTTLQKTNMIFYCDGCAAGANTITVNGGGGSTKTSVAIAEYSGQLLGHAADQFSVTEQTFVVPGGGIWSASPGCLVIGQFADNGGGSTWSAPSGITIQQLGPGGSPECGWGDNTNGVAGENIWSLTQGNPVDNLNCTACFLPATYKGSGTVAMVRTTVFPARQSGTFSSVANSFNSGNQAGNAIYFFVNFANFSANQATGVPTDTAGNTYTLLTSFHGSQGLNNFWAVYRADPCIGTSSLNIITLPITNQSYTLLNAFAVEITGQNSGAALDATASDNNGTTSKNFTISTTQANDLLFALFCHPTGGVTWSGYSGTRTFSLAAINNGLSVPNFSTQPPLDSTGSVQTNEDHFFQAAPNSGSQTITASSTSPFAIFTFAVKGLSLTSAPSFSPVGGSYSGAQTVTITGPGGSTIYYTTDGSTPTRFSASIPSGSSIVVPVGTTTVKAISSLTGFADSTSSSATYVLSSGIYSVPDCRVAPFGPNASRTVQGTVTYDVQTSSNHILPPTDSRVAPNIPVDSRVSPNIPQNSRAPGVYGPGNS